MSTIKAPPVYKVAVSQAVTLSLLVLSTAAFSSWINAYSLLIGGLICLIPGTLFARRAFKYRGARSAVLIVKELYKGEMIKLVMTGAGFALSFVYVNPLNELALFSGFVLVHITGLLMVVRISNPDRYNP
ncbi:MAG: ATP F0F1 synthase subunit I [Gammaproteobacteria bacterium]|nr:ATP F0F1 synthase subunit I [Gammaproteobacteria bacterium]|tara:strand:+ start:839 stop:1228 length:390 start_codon:yes stop_codon:yes gene_type:complete